LFSAGCIALSRRDLSRDFVRAIHSWVMRLFVLLLKAICERAIYLLTVTRPYCFKYLREASISCPDEDICDYPVFQCCHFLLVQLRYWQLLSWTRISPPVMKLEDFLLYRHTSPLLIKKKVPEPNSSAPYFQNIRTLMLILFFHVNFGLGFLS
jgi:hypothetical protein